VFPLKIGIQLTSLRLPFKQALLTAARLGAQAVEIDARNTLRPQDVTRTGLRHVRKLLDDLNLRVCAVGFRTRRGYDVLDELDQRVEATKRAMQLAYDLRAPIVVNHIGRVPEESAGPLWERLVETLNDLGHYGQRVGALLAAKTGSEDGSRLAALIQALLPGALVVSFDAGNLIVNGYSPRQALTVLADHVCHVHATDGVRDLARGRGVATPLGRGSADYPELMGILEEHQYRGYFTIERSEAANPVSEIGQAVQFLQHLGE
jgi:sugar phosphate isomerase/epimerase